MPFDLYYMGSPSASRGTVMHPCVVIKDTGLQPTAPTPHGQLKCVVIREACRPTDTRTPRIAITRSSVLCARKLSGGENSPHQCRNNLKGAAVIRAFTTRCEHQVCQQPLRVRLHLIEASPEAAR
jgi:hypothetical protein